MPKHAMTRDPLLRKASGIFARVAGSSRGRQLRHLKPVIGRLKREGYALRFGPLEEEKESAHFDRHAREIVIEQGTRGLPAEMVACLLVHEVQHAYDEFEGRPYTFEAELRAFKAEAVFLSAFEPERLAARAKDAYAWRWFSFLYENRVNLLKGDLDFESAAVRQFVKSHLGESHFEGLQSIPKVLHDTRESLRFKEGDLRQLERESRRGRSAAVGERLRILKADIAIGRRLESRLESEQRRNARLRMPLD